ncbi:MAG TPA: Nramp family divalent metal transporter, partial [bacterium]|nr:Nramp family divalent metal transporter [bacterium]
MSAPGPPPPTRFAAALRLVGPGIAVAATGVGAGDLVAAAKAGATYGLPVLWAAGLGAVLKFVLAEGIARWQLATGTTVLEGWVDRFGPVIRAWFLVYLVLWTLIVAAALMSACGLAIHALVPAVPVPVGGVLHGLAALVFVWFEGYGRFERLMKAAIGVMFVSILGTAVVQAPPLAETVRGMLVPTVPAGSSVLLLGVVGGVGGTLTLLSYNYWMREKGWDGPAWTRGVRVDLATGYVLTGVFGVALTLLAGAVL